jgi:hypothetical protein
MSWELLSDPQPTAIASAQTPEGLEETEGWKLPIYPRLYNQVPQSPADSGWIASSLHAGTCVWGECEVRQSVSHSCLHTSTQLPFALFQTPVSPDAVGCELKSLFSLSSRQGRAGTGEQDKHPAGAPHSVSSSEGAHLGRGGSQNVPALGSG